MVKLVITLSFSIVTAIVVFLLGLLNSIPILVIFKRLLLDVSIMSLLGYAFASYIFHIMPEDLLNEEDPLPSKLSFLNKESDSSLEEPLNPSKEVDMTGLHHNIGNSYKMVDPERAARTVRDYLNRDSK